MVMTLLSAIYTHALIHVQYSALKSYDHKNGLLSILDGRYEMLVRFD